MPGLPAARRFRAGGEASAARNVDPPRAIDRAAKPLEAAERNGPKSAHDARAESAVIESMLGERERAAAAGGGVSPPDYIAGELGEPPERPGEAAGGTGGAGDQGLPSEARHRGQRQALGRSQGGSGGAGERATSASGYGRAPSGICSVQVQRQRVREPTSTLESECLGGGMAKKLPASIPRIALTPAEAAAAIGVGPDFFDGQRRASELRLIRRGRKRLVPVAELERWVAETAEMGRWPSSCGDGGSFRATDASGKVRAT